MIPFHKDKLDEWLSDFEAFNYDFRRFCFTQFRVFELDATFVPNVLKQIHGQWVADCSDWLESEASKGTKQLSHTKILSLLLYNLISESFLGNMHNYKYDEKSKYSFAGTEEQKAKARQDLVDAREAALALDFCTMTIAWHEINKKVRLTPFKNPMAFDIRHDLIGYLLSGTADKKALYLIMHALFL